MLPEGNEFCYQVAYGTRRIIAKQSKLQCNNVMLRSQVFYRCSIISTIFVALLNLTTAIITAPWEVDALKAIKGSLNDPDAYLESWNQGDPCLRNWSHVMCYDTRASDGYFHVKELQLLNLRLNGTLAPELGQLSQMEIMDFMWNSISGGIPKEVGNITSLKLLLLNGNQLNGSIPEDIGFLPNLVRIQIDQNQLSGPIPNSFAYLDKIEHLYMNNNSLSGQIPPELSRLRSLVHLLLNNNNLSGYLPPELSQLPTIRIIQVDNNNFSGSSIPTSYGNISTLLKLSLRNCSLEGFVPDTSGIPQLAYLDLSWNQLRGPIPVGRFSSSMTTIDLSQNHLSGPIPGSFSGLLNLQILSLENNKLDGSVPSNIWGNVDFRKRSLILNFQNNSFANLSDHFIPPVNVSILLFGNPVCIAPNQLNISQYCQLTMPVAVNGDPVAVNGGPSSNLTCMECFADLPYSTVPLSPIPCFCAVPFVVEFQLKSPGFWDFTPYKVQFQQYLSSGLLLWFYQVEIYMYSWDEGPSLYMYMKLFPNLRSVFNASEVLRLEGMFTSFEIEESDIFGPYELLSIDLGWYQKILPQQNQNESSVRRNRGATVVAIVAATAAAAILSLFITVIILRRHSSKRLAKRNPITIDGVKDFNFRELARGTNDFSDLAIIGQGGYGKVYRGVLTDGTIVAVKRSQQGSLQGSKEFFTEIELLSRLHHRNLVTLLGYCDENDEQILVYEFMPNGTLREHLSVRVEEPLNFPTRLRIALGSAHGILYLHTEAEPPIFHRDIKASNILLDSKFIAKVADFGLSRLAPVPETEGNALGHVSTVVKGTPGYVDPEYFLTRKLTDRSDVYSLGVVFLELLTGMQPIYHGRNIVREIVAANQSGMLFSVIDSRMGSYPEECVERFAALALWCCRDQAKTRPSMVEVVRELEIIRSMTPGMESTNAPTTKSLSGSQIVYSGGRDYHCDSSWLISGR